MKIKLTKQQTGSEHTKSDDYQTKDGRYLVEKKWGLGGVVWWLIEDTKKEMPESMCRCDSLTEVRENIGDMK